jgi:archaemetzincin
MRRRELMVLLLGLGACERSRDTRAHSGPSPEPPGDNQPEPEQLTAKRESGPLGPLDDIPPALRPAFDERAHRPLPGTVAREGEAPQTYAEFVAERPPRPQPGLRTIAILPIGEYPRGFVVEYDAVRLVRSPEPTLIARFLEAWFGLPTRMLPAMSDEVLERLPARELEGRRQLDAAEVLEWLRGRRPADAACVLALTLEDLYADDAAWVFGYASIVERVGVHSMLRYDPGFADVMTRGPEFEHVILTRALRVLAHEVAHMFGLRHCFHFECLMNPTAGVEDLDRLPLHLCPVCLRKLWTVTGISIVARWEQLVTLCDELALHAEREWFAARLRALGLPRSPDPQ